jgi:hypothetical protein
MERLISIFFGTKNYFQHFFLALVNKIETKTEKSVNGISLCKKSCKKKRNEFKLKETQKERKEELRKRERRREREKEERGKRERE